MQLNSLTLNSNQTPSPSSSHLAIYDHKVATVNSSLFVFGKNFFNFNVQLPLHHLNLKTLLIQPVYTLNPPVFQDFMMFCFQQHIYFWGKSAISQENQLYQFYDSRFWKMDQKGIIPQFQGSFSFTRFSQHYLLIFGYLNKDQFQNKWYIFDIKKHQWKSLISNIKIPLCQKSQIIWINGRGYLLLRQVYDKKTKKYSKNIFYQIRFKNFSRLMIEFTEIQISPKSRHENLIFTHLFSFNEKQLILLGQSYKLIDNESFDMEKRMSSQFVDDKENEKLRSKMIEKWPQNPSQNIHNSKEKQYANTFNGISNISEFKTCYLLNLQLLQWSQQTIKIPIKGDNFQIATYDNKIFTIGGTDGNKLLSQIQCYNFKTLQIQKKFPYQQSLCYYCQCAFTYSQEKMYQPMIENDYDNISANTRIENKLLKKISQSINTQIHAIGIICSFLDQLKVKSIQIDLFQFMKPQINIQIAKPKIQTVTSQVLGFKAVTIKNGQQHTLRSLFQGQSKDFLNYDDEERIQKLHYDFTLLKIGCFRLGYGLLYVESIQQGSVFVGYCSHSQTDFPESNFRCFSQTFYIVNINKHNNQIKYSSEINRKIIFENVKLYFGTPEQYQNITQIIKNENNNFLNLYVIGTTTLENFLNPQDYLQDIKVKSLNNNNPFNSLRRYFMHFYLNPSGKFQLFLSKKAVELVDIYQKLQQFTKTKKLIEIPSIEETCLKKSQFEQTHFSTNHDQVIIGWKRLQFVDRCKFYQIKKSSLSRQIYRCVLVYQRGKLIKNLRTKRSLITGVIELSSSIDIKINSGQFATISIQRQFTRWIEQIQRSCYEEIQ